jgi:hypothetical protein
MSKGSKRPSWKVVRNRFNATGRELAALALAANPPAPYVAPAPQPRIIRAPAQPKPTRAPKVMNERETAIKAWYLYGGADDMPPDGLTDAELMRVRERFCK